MLRCLYYWWIWSFRSWIINCINWVRSFRCNFAFTSCYSFRLGRRKTSGNWNHLLSRGPYIVWVSEHEILHLNLLCPCNYRCDSPWSSRCPWRLCLESFHFLKRNFSRLHDSTWRIHDWEYSGLLFLLYLFPTIPYHLLFHLAIIMLMRTWRFLRIDLWLLNNDCLGFLFVERLKLLRWPLLFLEHANRIFAISHLSSWWVL